MSFRGLDSDRALCRYPTLATPLGDVSYAAIAVIRASSLNAYYRPEAVVR